MRNIVNSGWKFCSVRYALIVACAGAGQLAGVAGAPGSIRARDLKLTLVTYDHVCVGGEILAGAENTASKIFRRADVQLILREGLAYAAERLKARIPPPEDAVMLVVKLQPPSEAASSGVRSLPGPDAYSTVGIIRGMLLHQNWEKAAQATPDFTHSQSQQIRTRIAKRIRCCRGSQRNRSVSGDPLLARAPMRTPTITVQVYTGAAIPPKTWTAAEDEAARIFRVAGVVVSWLNCHVPIQEAEGNPNCIEPCPPGRVAVRIISEMPADLGNRSLGVALSESGIYATIYYPRVEKYANEAIATDAQILGYAIAHEMCHLLLGPGAHASFGIMRGQWTDEDLHSIAMGFLRFSPQQSALIRQAAMRRMGSEKGSAPALPFVKRY